MKKLLNERIPLLKKADIIFGSSESKAKKCFLDIVLMNGGIEDGCEILGLSYEKYVRKFNNAKSNQAKAMVQLNFTDKIKAFLVKRFGI